MSVYEGSRCLSVLGSRISLCLLFISFPKNNNLLFILSFAVFSIFLDEIHRKPLNCTSPLMVVGDLNLHCNVFPNRRALTFTMLNSENLIPDNGKFFELFSHLYIYYISIYLLDI